MRKNSFVIVMLCILQGCTLPSSGPTPHSMQDIKGIKIVEDNIDSVNRNRDTYRSYKKLFRESSTVTDRVLLSGDTVNIVLWVMSSDNPLSEVSMLPRKIDFGHFEVMKGGKLYLPYIHNMYVSGLTLAQAGEKITKAFVEKHLFIHPTVVVSYVGNVSSAADGILVAGDVRHAGIIPWRSGGMTLSRVLAEASPEYSNENLDYEVVEVYHKDHLIFSGDLSRALLMDTQLPHASHVIVRESPSKHIVVMGGGIAHSENVTFKKSLSLAQALADARGLNPENAYSNEVFVFRYERNIPTLHVVNMHRGDGIFVSRGFMLRDHDIIYVAEVPMMSAVRVLSVIVQLGILGSIAH